MTALDELERLEKAATPGPWKALPGMDDIPDRCDGIEDAHGNRVVTTDSGVYDPDFATAQLIAAARNALPDLLKIARAMGSREPTFWDEGNDGQTKCVICRGEDGPMTDGRVEHAADCAWLLARRLAVRSRTP